MVGGSAGNGPAADTARKDKRTRVGSVGPAVSGRQCRASEVGPATSGAADGRSGQAVADCANGAVNETVDLAAGKCGGAYGHGHLAGPGLHDDRDSRQPDERHDRQLFRGGGNHGADGRGHGALYPVDRGRRHDRQPLDHRRHDRRSQPERHPAHRWHIPGTSSAGPVRPTAPPAVDPLSAQPPTIGSKRR